LDRTIGLKKVVDLPESSKGPLNCCLFHAEAFRGYFRVTVCLGTEFEVHPGHSTKHANVHVKLFNIMELLVIALPLLLKCYCWFQASIAL